MSISKQLRLATTCLALGSFVIPQVVLADEVDNWDKIQIESSRLKPMEPVVDRTPVHHEVSPEGRSGGKTQVAQKVSGAAAAGTAAGLPSAHPEGESHGKPGVMLKGGVTFVVPKGTPLKLKLATIPIPELKQELRDEEGHLRPAQLNEKITAKITEDMFIDDNKVIPEGTVFYGKVSKLIPPRHVGRPGHLELKFDHFTTPDGRSFAFKAEANNFKPSTMKTKLQGAGIIAAHAAGGAALGTIIAYQLFGYRGTVATHGYNIAGGAAAGAIGGIAWALWRRGREGYLEPGDEFNMAIDTDMLIPAATSPTPKKPPVTMPGLELDVIKKKVFKDPLGGGPMMRLELFVVNQTHQRLDSMDLYIEDEMGTRYPVSPDIDDTTETLFHIEPLSATQIKVAFKADFPKLKHKIIWVDHKKRGHVLVEKPF